MKGDSGDQGPRINVKAWCCRVLKVLLERFVKLDRQDPLEIKAVLENVVKKGTREMLVLVDLVVKKVRREMSVPLVPKGL